MCMCVSVPQVERIRDIEVAAAKLEEGSRWRRALEGKPLIGVPTMPVAWVVLMKDGLPKCAVRGCRGDTAVKSCSENPEL